MAAQRPVDPSQDQARRAQEATVELPAPAEPPRSGPFGYASLPFSPPAGGRRNLDAAHEKRLSAVDIPPPSPADFVLGATSPKGGARSCAEDDVVWVSWQPHRPSSSAWQYLPVGEVGREAARRGTSNGNGDDTRSSPQDLSYKQSRSLPRTWSNKRPPPRNGGEERRSAKPSCKRWEGGASASRVDADPGSRPIRAWLHPIDLSRSAPK